MEKEQLTIKPIKYFDKIITAAADKSITHRAVMFLSAASGTGKISNALMGEDCLSTIDCMRNLGAKIEVEGSCVTVTGAERFASANLNAGNSGTTMRLLSGLVSGKLGEFTLCGDASLSARPMNRIITPLSSMGAKIASTNGLAPLKIIGANLKGIDYTMPISSAQVKSAILLAGINADGNTCVHEKIKSRDHTERMLKALGANLQVHENSVTVSRSNLKAKDFIIPSDISSAAFALVLAAASGGRVTTKNVGLNATRDGILEVLDCVGADIKISNKINLYEPTGDITLTARTLKPFKLTEDIMPRLIDEIPILAVLACFIKGKSIISGAGELKVKESDRLKAIYNMVTAFGGSATLTADGIEIDGRGSLEGGCSFDSCGDHRMAMSAGVAAALSIKGGTVLDAKCADVSYPNFFSEVLDS